MSYYDGMSPYEIAADGFNALEAVIDLSLRNGRSYIIASRAVGTLFDWMDYLLESKA